MGLFNVCVAWHAAAHANTPEGTGLVVTNTITSASSIPPFGALYSSGIMTPPLKSQFFFIFIYFAPQRSTGDNCNFPVTGITEINCLNFCAIFGKIVLIAKFAFSWLIISFSLQVSQQFSLFVPHLTFCGGLSPNFTG